MHKGQQDSYCSRTTSDGGLYDKQVFITSMKESEPRGIVTVDAQVFRLCCLRKLLRIGSDTCCAILA